jgi:hypothetical protein
MSLLSENQKIRVYYCSQIHEDVASPNCPRHIGAKKATEIVWQKICDVIDLPDYLLGQARQLVKQILESQASFMEQQLIQLRFQVMALRSELSSLGEAVNINALEDWESKVVEFLAAAPLLSLEPFACLSLQSSSAQEMSLSQIQLSPYRFRSTTHLATLDENPP